MDISVVVPLLNEAESLPELEAWIRRVMDENGFSYEIVFVDDGSTDNSWAVIQQLSEANPNVKALRFRRNGIIPRGSSHTSRATLKHGRICYISTGCIKAVIQLIC